MTPYGRSHQCEGRFANSKTSLQLPIVQGHTFERACDRGLRLHLKHTSIPQHDICRIRRPDRTQTLNIASSKDASRLAPSAVEAASLNLLASPFSPSTLFNMPWSQSQRTPANTDPRASARLTPPRSGSEVQPRSILTMGAENGGKSFGDEGQVTARCQYCSIKVRVRACLFVQNIVPRLNTELVCVCVCVRVSVCLSLPLSL